MGRVRSCNGGNELAIVGSVTTGNVDLRRRPGFVVGRCVRGVSIYVRTTSLVVDHYKTNTLARVRTMNYTSLLVPSPVMTRGRRCRGNVILTGTSTTMLCRRGSTSPSIVVSRITGLVSSPRHLREVSRGSTGLCVASAPSHVGSMVESLLGWPGCLYLRVVRRDMV